MAAKRVSYALGSMLGNSRGFGCSRERFLAGGPTPAAAAPLVPPMHSPPSWTLSGSIARRGEATVDLTAPERGLTIGVTGDRLLGLDLGIEDRITPDDHWLRGDDVVAVYDVPDHRHLRATALWRWLPGPPAAWELVVSAQTSLLESDPHVAVHCDLADGVLTWGRPVDGCLVWNPIEQSEECPAEASCILVERPDDTVIIAAQPDGRRRLAIARCGERVRVECRLFATTIEKGVLLRSRIRAANGPTAARDQAAAILAAFAASPPPLTS